MVIITLLGDNCLSPSPLEGVVLPLLTNVAVAKEDERMSKNKQSRKYLLTINNPKEHGLTHVEIKKRLLLSNPRYFCMTDEIGENGTYHTHVFSYFHSPIRWSTIKKRFPEAHIDISYGSVKENVEYLKKCGKWADTNKAETNLPDTFEEYGEIPAERNEDYPEMLEIIDDIEAGKSTSEIVKSHPNLALRTAKINELRETLRTDTYSEKKRKLDVIYVYSAVDVELIDYVYNRHSAKDICRMTNYGKNGVTNFDCYRGQKIIVFDSFNSSIPIEAMNVYLSDYPCELPARYTNRAAAYETVYILSFIPLERQYRAMSENDVMLKHFRSKVKKIIEFTENGEVKERDPHG